MRLIDADELIKKLGIADLPIKLLFDINNMKPVDAVQVVRCKDCRYYYPAEYDKKGNTCLLLREMINAPLWVKEDDYCSKGEIADNGKARTV